MNCIVRHRIQVQAWNQKQKKQPGAPATLVRPRESQVFEGATLIFQVVAKNNHTFVIEDVVRKVNRGDAPTSWFTHDGIDNQTKTFVSEAVTTEIEAIIVRQAFK